jgi:predicted DCC family thiol-disulfide oxidoreductase YuxK
MTPIVYFDGLCNLCDGFARFLLARPGGKRLRLASLQGETARARLGDRFGAEPQTIVLEQADRFRVRSDAVIAILTRLGGPWKLAAVLHLVPRPLRDAAYDFIARRRARWWGRRDACRVPTAEERERFLP